MFGCGKDQPGRKLVAGPFEKDRKGPGDDLPSIPCIPSLPGELQSEERTMNKKPPVSRFSRPKPENQTAELSWNNGYDIEVDLYARSLHKAAKTLIETLDLVPSPKTAWDACPVILLYRQAVELRLKALVGEGSGCLPSPTDSISLSKTRSLRWLAQIVCQIIRAVKWERDFQCEGVASLADFSALVNELEELDPVSGATKAGSSGRDGSAPHQLQPPKVVRFAGKLDALLALLDVTADALAARAVAEARSTALRTSSSTPRSSPRRLHRSTS
jgi:hypothetical protein